MKKWLKYVGILLAVFVMTFAVGGTDILRVQAAATSSASKKKKNGWVTKGTAQYYYKNGKAVTGWKTISGQKYYFTKSGKKKGRMVTGLQTISGKKYYFEKSGDKKGQMITGWKTIGGKKYYFTKSGKKKGQAYTGLKTIGGKKYYFTASGSKKGQMITGWKKIKKAYYYFDEEGASVASKTVNSSRKSDKTGTAAKKVYKRAQAIVEQITTEEMNKKEKLKACFNYVMKYTGRRPRTPHYCGKDWPVTYANDMFLEGSGNCFSYAAAFAYMAKACGYTEVYACNSTGHGWVEIGGKVYDPEQYRNTKYKYYGAKYSSAPGYWRAISDWKTYKFKRVKIA